MQKMFETILEHLRAQGRKSVTLDGTFCLYRDPEGLKCAVGVLISDEDYNSDMEGKTAFQLRKLWPDERVRNFLKDCQDKLHDSQDIHLSDLEEAARVIAKKWNLNYDRS